MERFAPEHLRAVVRCPLCGGTDRRTVYAHAYGVEVLRCACGLYHSAMEFTPAGHDAYWQRYFADEHTSDAGDCDKRRRMYDVDYAYVGRFLGPSARVLDVGCADGGFLDRFAADGHACFGVEIAHDAVCKAKAKHRVFEGVFPDLDIPSGFDLVVFRGMLQYVSRPRDYFAKAVSLLADGGIVYVTAQPDMDSFCHGLYRERFRFSPSPCDVIGFTPSLLEREFGRLGCRLAVEAHFYEQTPYADPPNDIAAVMAAMDARAAGRQIEGMSPAFWGNMMTLVFRKCPKAARASRDVASGDALPDGTGDRQDMGGIDRRVAAFKAYDIRGSVPESLTWKLAFALGMACCEILAVRKAVVGRDVRLSGPMLLDGLCMGLVAMGAEVADIGVCGTEEIYNAAGFGDFDVGIMVTGSHNPANENGFKIVRRGAVPVSADSGLHAIRDRVAELLARQDRDGADAVTIPVRKCADIGAGPPWARVQRTGFRAEYVERLLGIAGLPVVPGRRLRIVCDAGNGSAGLLLDGLAARLPFEVIGLNVEPDGRFPNGVPNPLLPDRREATAHAVRDHSADMGVAWDGDFDRCFLYDAEGNFIEGYYCVGLLAGEVLRRFPGGRVVHDTRVYWNTRELVLAAGGIPVMGKTGHAFMKERMRAEEAVYGGEMSAHHYFREFACCDSGMLPWMLVAGCMLRTGKPLAELVGDRMRAYPCSGEINRRIANAGAVIESVWRRYEGAASHADRLDGINMELAGWRFSLRMSNTEPILRLNVESRGDRGLMEDRTQALLRQIDEEGESG